MDVGDAQHGPTEFPLVALRTLWQLLSNEDLASTRLVCRLWKKNVTDQLTTWQVRAPCCQSDWADLRGTLYCMAPVLQQLTIVIGGKTSHKVLREVLGELSWWSRLHSVHLTFLKPRQPLEAPKAIPLEDLQLEDEPDSEDEDEALAGMEEEGGLAVVARLRTLVVTGAATMKDLARTLRAQTELRTLSLDAGMRSEPLLPLLMGLVGLTELRFGYPLKQDSAKWQELLSALPHLEVLVLHERGAVNEQIVREVFKPHPRLRSLTCSIAGGKPFAGMVNPLGPPGFWQTLTALQEWQALRLTHLDIALPQSPVSMLDDIRQLVGSLQGLTLARCDLSLAHMDALGSLSGLTRLLLCPEAPANAVGCVREEAFFVPAVEGGQGGNLRAILPLALLPLGLSRLSRLQGLAELSMLVQPEPEHDLDGPQAGCTVEDVAALRTFQLQPLHTLQLVNCVFTQAALDLALAPGALPTLHSLQLAYPKLVRGELRVGALMALLKIPRLPRQLRTLRLANVELAWAMPQQQLAAGGAASEVGCLEEVQLVGCRLRAAAPNMVLMAADVALMASANAALVAPNAAAAHAALMAGFAAPVAMPPNVPPMAPEEQTLAHLAQVAPGLRSLRLQDMEAMDPARLMLLSCLTALTKLSVGLTTPDCRAYDGVLSALAPLTDLRVLGWDLQYKDHGISVGVQTMAFAYANQLLRNLATLTSLQRLHQVVLPKWANVRIGWEVAKDSWHLPPVVLDACYAPVFEAWPSTSA